MLRCLIIFFSFISVVRAQTEAIPFIHIGQEAGLSHNSVYAITQDHQGYLWIGTQDGLNRYDGYNFIIYRYDPADSTSLSNNVVWDVLEDRMGQLWIGTAYGLNRFDRTDDVFVRYDFPSSTADTDRPVYPLFEDRSGILWAGTNNGLFHYNRKADSFEIKANIHGEIWGIQEYPSGTLWVLANDAGTYQVYQFSIRSEKQSNPGEPRVYELGSPDKDHSHPFPIDESGRFWISNTDFWIHEQAGHPFKRFAGFPSHVGTRLAMALSSQDGSLWVGTLSGVYSIETDSNQALRHEMDREGFRDLHDEVRSLFEDQTGTIWAGTHAGLYKRDPSRKAFHHYTYDPNTPSGLPGAVVMSLLNDRNRYLWVSVYGQGVSKMDPDGNIVETYPLNPEISSSNCNDVAWDIHEDTSGTLWLATSTGLCRFNESMNRFEPFGDHLADLRSMDEDASGNLWITSYSGLYRFEPRSGTIRLFDRPSSDPRNQSRGYEGLYIMGSDVWVGGINGALDRLDTVRDTFVSYQLKASDGRLLRNTIWTIHSDSEGRLFLGTDAGLIHFDPISAQVLNHYSDRNGLPGTVVYSILPDQQGRFWLGTNFGLSRFDDHQPEGQKFKNYDASDGIGSTEFNRRSAFRDRDGRLYFGGMNGVTHFLPSGIHDNTNIPNIVLNQIQFSRREGTTVLHPFDLEHLTLSYQDYTFSFGFAALNFTNSEKNRYAYRLEGFETDWIDAGTSRLARYTNIPPGNYVFRVKGSNNDGIWNEEGVGLNLTITPPFWKTTWFRFLALVLILGLMAGSYGYRVRSLKQRQKDLELVVEERTRRLIEEKRKTEEQARAIKELDQAKNRFFTNISHEFRTPLTLIISPLRSALDDPERNASLPKASMLTNATKVLHLIDQLLDLSKLEAGKLEISLQSVELVGWLQQQVLSFAPLAEHNKIQLQFRSDHDAFHTEIDVDKAGTILSNLISNALKFTPAGGKVWVTLNRWQEPVPEFTSINTSPQAGVGSPPGRYVQERVYAQINIKDTGPGIIKEDLSRIFNRFEQASDPKRSHHTGTGIGLALAKELTDLLGGQLLVRSEPGFGSVFILRLPVSESLSQQPSSIPTFADHVGHLNFEPQMSDFMDTPEGSIGQLPERPSTILLIDDNPDIRQLLRNQLAPFYRILQAEDGLEGLHQITEASPDLILCDVMMGEMDGIELCRTIKSDPELNAIPIILLTARSSDHAVLEGLEAGADDYIIKPFHPKTLKAKIDNLIASRSRLRDQYSRSILLKPTDMEISSEDEVFLQELVDHISRHLDDADFSVAILADLMAMSRRQLERKVKSVCEKSPADLIRSLRMERASELLHAQAGSIADIAYQVGFRSPSHFTATFKSYFGEVPSEYVKDATKSI